ncbi:MAG: cysteine hydrolase [Firmicutes bacterium]|nr:cysteine hydrolase [Bacillota bacterium]
MDNGVMWNVERGKAVLLVVDMQNDFVLEGAVMEVPDAKKQLPKIKGLIDECRRLDIPVIYTVHITDGVFNPLEIAAFPHLKSAGMRAGTKGAEVVDALRPHADDIIIRKRRFSAFYQTDLELILRSLRGRAVDTVIICGTVSNICCESTARDAFFRDFKVVFGADICSALNPSAHNATLANMELFGRVMKADSIIKALQRNC